VSAAPGPGPARPQGSGASGFAGAPGAPPPRKDGPQNIATAITDVSERVALLVHEEVELAKAEVSEKAAKLARGAVVAVAAGIFVVTALFLVLVGCAWLLYYVLPVPTFAYFWGFFAMAVILLVLGALAGLVAAKVVKKSSPPVPTMAIEEARLIRETMGSGSGRGDAQGVPAGGPYAASGASAFPTPGTPGGGAA
jgi:uncharacterized membrane protein YqjE